MIIWGRASLTNWPRFFGTAFLGTGSAWLAYKYLILPNRSLLPDIEQMGNELWIAIAFFLYAVANKIPTTSGPNAAQTNHYVAKRYNRFSRRYSKTIDRLTNDDQLLKLTVYSVMIYEDYCRPSTIRFLERILRRRTTGIMQVASKRPLGDQESVELGTQILCSAWVAQSHHDRPSDQIYHVLCSYNRDSTYASRVLEVMEVVAKRADRSFESHFNSQYTIRGHQRNIATCLNGSASRAHS